VIIEAPRKSGTLCTARFAIEQNRELLVVPGSITNPNFEGSHDLLKQGAQIVTNSNDILMTLGIDTSMSGQKELPFLDDVQKKILEYLTEHGEPVHTDALCGELNISAAEAGESLTMLVLMNVIKETGGKYYV
jgi:DNA processing protein